MTAHVVAVTVAALVLTSARPGPVRLPDAAAPGSTIRLCRAGLVDALDRALPDVRRRRRDRQLPHALDRLASALRAGDAIGPALAALAPEVAEPLGRELRAIAGLIDHGAPVTEALSAWSASKDSSDDVRMVAAALTIGARAGGAVARAVDGVAATLRERHELRAEVRALATQARSSAAVLATAPAGFALLVAAVEPRSIRFLLTTPAGLACLVAGIGLDAVGVLWMARITRSAG
jgi:Flp pilus assembly protein TadB